ncbi:hypothetical protein AB395_00005150 (plasmid) [Sinorhizobium fredii CCBAU 45436]|nr:hypothetical protein AB395_00005150 [Sinorhizobium fredii CCBAU 45436]
MRQRSVCVNARFSRQKTNILSEKNFLRTGRNTPRLFRLTTPIARFLLENSVDCAILGPFLPTRKEQAMSLRINETAPDFTAETTHGPINFHEWIGDGWAVLFSHPKNFTPVCTTELGAMAGVEGDFRKRGVKIIGISVDPVDSHAKWKNDIKVATGFDVEYPLIGDRDLKVAKLYDMLPAGAGDTSEGRTPADNATVRSVYVIGPDKKIKLILTYPMTTGRNFNEILRAIDSIQLTAKHQVATPANWKQGEDVIITAAVSNEDAIQRFGSFDTVLPYLRKTKQPTA